MTGSDPLIVSGSIVMLVRSSRSTVHLKPPHYSLYSTVSYHHCHVSAISLATEFNPGGMSSLLLGSPPFATSCRPQVCTLLTDISVSMSSTSENKTITLHFKLTGGKPFVLEDVRSDITVRRQRAPYTHRSHYIHPRTSHWCRYRYKRGGFR